MPDDRKERRRYRKVHIRMWGDERFMQLSKPKPNGQTLWLYLLTGQHTTVIPGLFVAGEASLAEGLQWPLPAFRRCFAELTTKGMAFANWSARVVWLPNSVRYNPPESPNVVKAWRRAMDEIPECHLKFVAALALKEFVEGLPKGFHEGLGQDWPKTSCNQEQEQEQDKDQELTGAKTAPDRPCCGNPVENP